MLLLSMVRVIKECAANCTEMRRNEWHFGLYIINEYPIIEYLKNAQDVQIMLESIVIMYLVLLMYLHLCIVLCTY